LVLQSEFRFHALTAAHVNLSSISMPLKGSQVRSRRNERHQVLLVHEVVAIHLTILTATVVWPNWPVSASPRLSELVVLFKTLSLLHLAPNFCKLERGAVPRARKSVPGGLSLRRSHVGYE
jgi:hypothetical protein